MNFINPYNFVSPDSKVWKEAYRPRDKAVLDNGRELLTGRMIFEMKAITPIITADSDLEYYSITHKDNNAETLPLSINHAPDFNPQSGDEVLYEENKQDNSITIYPFNNDNANLEIASHLTGEPEKDIETINTWAPQRHKGIFFLDEQNRERIKSKNKTDLVCHGVRKFFNYKGKYIIPADSLKGAIRNLVETFSNSCFSVFYSTADNRLGYRQIPGIGERNSKYDTRYGKTNTARISKNGGRWEAHLCKSARIKRTMLIDLARLLKIENYEDLADKPCQVNINNVKIIYIQDIKTYPPREGDYIKARLDSWVDKMSPAYFILENGDFFCKPKNWGGENNRDWSQITRDINFKQGEEYFIKFGFRTDRMGRCITYPEITSISCDGQTVLRTPSTGGTRFTLINRPEFIRVENSWFNQPGYIKITGSKSAENKTCERIFYNIRQDSISVEDAAVKRYNAMIEEQRIICKPDNYDRHTKHGGNLKDGSLVYVIKDERQITFMSHVSIPRMWFKKGPIEALRNISPDLMPCSDLNQLCPACRLFGTLTPKTKNGLAGKVHFSPAFCISDPQKVTAKDITLAPLSSPKPTSVNFYLKHPTNNDLVVSYDSEELGAKPALRGRKWYFHYKPNTEALNQATQTSQNSTCQYLYEEDLTFTFSIDFYAITQEELGLLLLALCLPGDYAYKIGMGKPLGFGSVKNKLTELRIYNPSKRFASLKDPGELEPKLSVTEKQDKYIKEYMSAYLEFLNNNYNKDNLETVFKELPHIKELLIMLSFDWEAGSIKYPSKNKNGFSWFMDNREKTLKTPQQIKVGSTQAGWS